MNFSIIPPWMKVVGILVVLAAVYGAGELRRALADAQEIGANDEALKDCRVKNADYAANEKTAIEKGEKVRDQLEAAQTKIGDLSTQLLQRQRERPRIAPAADCAAREVYTMRESAKVLADHRSPTP